MPDGRWGGIERRRPLDESGSLRFCASANAKRERLVREGRGWVRGVNRTVAREQRRERLVDRDEFWHTARPAELPLLCAQVPSMDNITEGFAGELDHVHTLLVEEDPCRSPATDQLPSLDCGSSDDGGAGGKAHVWRPGAGQLAERLRPLVDELPLLLHILVNLRTRAAFS